MAGLVLLIAVGFKVYEAWVAPRPAEPWWLAGLVGVETLAGLWFLSGLRRRLAHHAAILLFAAFAVYNTVQIAQGIESCGCFGAAKVHPAWTLGFDLLIVAGLIACRQSSALRIGGDKAILQHCGHLIGSLVMMIIVPIILMLAVYGLTQRRSAMILDRQHEQVRAFVESFEMLDGLAGQQWTLLLYDSCCPTCIQAINSRMSLLQVQSDWPRPIAVDLCSRGSHSEIMMPNLPLTILRGASDTSRQVWHGPLPVAFLISRKGTPVRQVWPTAVNPL